MGPNLPGYSAVALFRGSPERPSLTFWQESTGPTYNPDPPTYLAGLYQPSGQPSQVCIATGGLQRIIVSNDGLTVNQALTAYGIVTIPTSLVLYGLTVPAWPANNGTYELRRTGSTLEWVTASGGSGGGGTVTSVSGTGSVAGITLSGTVTTSGSLTLGGSLILPTHASSHRKGGGDSIKLDDLDDPDDNTDLNATTQRHGLLPKLLGDSTKFLRSDGLWAEPAGGSGGGGTIWHSGSGTPAGSLGNVGDRYLNTTTGDHYEKTGASTWTLRGSLMGPTGPPGSVWHSGTTNPDGGTGVVGDRYLNTTTGDHFEKTSASTWTNRGNLKGASGAPGSVWHSGSGTPAGSLGNVGDRYLNTATGDHYEKTGASTWTLRGNLTGPQGSPGIGLVFWTVAAHTDGNNDGSFRSILPTLKGGTSATFNAGTLTAGTVLILEAGGIMNNSDNFEPELEVRLGGLTLFFLLKEPGSHTGGPLVWVLKAWITIVAMGSPATVAAYGHWDGNEQSGATYASYCLRASPSVTGSLNTGIANTLGIFFRGKSTTPSITCQYAYCMKL